MKRFVAMLMILTLMMSVVPVSSAQESRARGDYFERETDRRPEKQEVVQVKRDAMREPVNSKGVSARQDATAENEAFIRGKEATDARLKSTRARKETGIRKDSAHALAKVQHLKIKELNSNPELRVFTKENQFTVRKIANKLRNAQHETYTLARKQAQERIALTHENRESLRVKKAAFDACSDDCTVAEDELRGEARHYLGNSAQAIISTLEQFKARVESSEHLSDDRAGELVARINAKIADVKDSLSSITEDSSRDDLRIAAKRINANWKDIKTDLHKAKRRLSQGKVGAVLVQSEHIQLKLQNAIVKLEGRGVDTTSLIDHIATFHGFVTTAKTEYEAAQNTEDDKQAQNHLDTAKEAMKNARHSLKAIVAEFKELKGYDAIAEASDEEVELEDESGVEAEDTE